MVNKSGNGNGPAAGLPLPTALPAGKRPDVIVIGAGLIGLAIARALAQRGVRVQVLEAGQPGRQASWAGAGMLSAHQLEPNSPLRPLGLRSLELFPAWVAQLESETGITVDLRRDGTLLIDRHLASPPEGFEPVSAADVARLEPGLREVSGVWRVGEDGCVDNRKLLAALLGSLERLGVPIQTGQTVRRLLPDGAGWRLETGERSYLAARVVNCAGAWAGSINVPPAALSLDEVRPRKGQILSLRTQPGRLPLRHVIVRHGEEFVYLVPRSDGRIVIGATMEDVGFDPAVDTAVIAELRRRAESLLPALSGLHLDQAWAGLRPGTRDDLPLLGPALGAPGYWLAAGHFRDGILLTPATAELISAWMLDGVPPAPKRVPVSAFAPARFLAAGHAAHAPHPLELAR